MVRQIPKTSNCGEFVLFCETNSEESFQKQCEDNEELRSKFSNAVRFCCADMMERLEAVTRHNAKDRLVTNAEIQSVLQHNIKALTTIIGNISGKSSYTALKEACEKLGNMKRKLQNPISMGFADVAYREKMALVIGVVFSLRFPRNYKRIPSERYFQFVGKVRQGFEASMATQVDVSMQLPDGTPLFKEKEITSMRQDQAFVTEFHRRYPQVPPSEQVIQRNKAVGQQFRRKLRSLLVR